MSRPTPPPRRSDSLRPLIITYFHKAHAYDRSTPANDRPFSLTREERPICADFATKVRATYTDLAAWSLFDDTVETLDLLQRDGWRHAILSNHVPELPQLIESLGLGSLIGCIVNSAVTGFEKPHPRAFQAALAALGNPEEVWMIGDNVVADVLGAEAAGLRAILVREDDSRARLRAASLRSVRAFLP